MSRWSGRVAEVIVTKDARGECEWEWDDPSAVYALMTYDAVATLMESAGIKEKP